CRIPSVAALGDTLFPAASLAAGFRADAAPDAHVLIRLRVLHPLLAILLGGYLSAVIWIVARIRPASAERKWGRVVSGFVLLQLGVGLANLFLLAPTALQLVHLLVADLLWIGTVLYTATALSAPRAAPLPRPLSPPSAASS
ncbi:MAG: protoheme IX farnesyltransferase, partial [Gemmatimonadales bacterium]|nr:protoheme IX farnesyltransferase [Gemmatimonadales bacterium]